MGIGDFARKEVAHSQGPGEVHGSAVWLRLLQLLLRFAPSLSSNLVLVLLVEGGSRTEGSESASKSW